jgi:hypothetical protein
MPVPIFARPAGLNKENASTFEIYYSDKENQKVVSKPYVKVSLPLCVYFLIFR